VLLSPRIVDDASPRGAVMANRPSRIGSIVFRCFEFERMVAFWSAALGYVPDRPSAGGWVILKDPAGRAPSVSLDRAPEPRTGRRGWIHLDLYAERQADEVERLVRLGATRYPWRYHADADYVVLEDPDGNLFCVVQA
jgi:catechol 2,3-dioxygenase-like lactoylglutathione lyase family enzyme